MVVMVVYNGGNCNNDGVGGGGGNSITCVICLLVFPGDNGTRQRAASPDRLAPDTTLVTKTFSRTYVLFPNYIASIQINKFI